MIIQRLLDCFFPAVCPACRQQAGSAICGGCIENIPSLNNPCPYCSSQRTDEATSCSQCHDASLPGLRYIQTIGSYTASLEQLINDAKAGSRAGALQGLAQLAAKHANVEQAEAIIPLPPNPGRREGQHLATVCAEAIAKRNGLPLLRVLRTTRPAAEQHILMGSDRQRAVDNIFTCKAFNGKKQFIGL